MSARGATCRLAVGQKGEENNNRRVGIQGYQLGQDWGHPAAAIRESHMLDTIRGENPIHGQRVLRVGVQPLLSGQLRPDRMI